MQKLPVEAAKEKSKTALMKRQIALIEQKSVNMQVRPEVLFTPPLEWRSKNGSMIKRGLP